MKLGSLFDGSGGFPLAGALCGIEPVWASEIEPYPLRVTAARFPNVKQLGDVTRINGAEIEPVDIITFGSPCQDLSIAGKQAGIHEGQRSNLFFEAIRIIHEMRGGTHGVYPNFALWENVPGAFSSGRGEDFRCVLQAFVDEIEGEGKFTVPRPERWLHAGEVRCDHGSVAWRVFDAQYWGVPQRRRRIYLVADFTGQRAGEILFERESLSGYSEPRGEAREGAADDAERGAGRSGGIRCLNPWDLQSKRQYETSGVYPALSAGERSGQNQSGVCFDITGESSNSMKSPTPDSCFRPREISRTLDGFCGSPNCNQGGEVVVAAFSGGQGADAGGIAYPEKIAPTLKTSLAGGDAVPECVYPNVARTLEARHDSSPCVDRGQNIVVARRPAFGEYVMDDLTSALKARDYKDATDLVVAFAQNQQVLYDMTHADDVVRECEDVSPTLQHRMGTGGNQIPIKIDGAKPPRKYVIRRLTPLECCRLQGFPDWWEDGVQGSDSARYKMWGNGIALPNAVYVMQGFAKEGRERYCI